MHLPLVAVASVAGFFGGALLGARVAVLLIGAVAAVGTDAPWVNLFLGAPCFFGGAIIGLKTAGLSVIRLVPVSCPRCYARTTYVSGGPITYQCGRCHHVHRTCVWQR